MDFDPKKNYYDILGVDESASADEIKKAFRKAAVKHHPDKKWWDKEKFQSVNEAHTVLWDDQKRQQYDSYRKGGFWWWFGVGFWWGGWFWWWFGGVDLGDLMWGMFGGGWWGRVSTQWEDIKLSLTITFEESFLGVEKTIKYTRLMMAEGVKEQSCADCGGRGVVAQQVRTPFGVMQTQWACQVCWWLGSSYTKDGVVITNGGLIEQEEMLDLDIPAGIRDDVYLKYASRGSFGPGGKQPWDLYIKINVKASSLYTRKGDDLYVNQDVSLFHAVLWWKLEVNHPAWPMTIKIPKGTQPSQKIKISGKGFGKRWLLSHVGDMYIVPQVAIPKRLSKDDEKMWKTLAENAWVDM